MSEKNELMPCPGGCGQQVHHRADACPSCGYRPEISDVEGLLASLSTVCSILVGFGLAALVTLATADSNAAGDEGIQWAVRCWILSSILLLVVLVLAEFTRREASGSRLRILAVEEDRIWRRCEQLLWAFTIALFGVTAGIVLIGFHFSLDHGILGCVASGVGLLMVIRSFR